MSIWAKSCGLNAEDLGGFVNSFVASVLIFSLR